MSRSPQQCTPLFSYRFCKCGWKLAGEEVSGRRSALAGSILVENLTFDSMENACSLEKLLQLVEQRVALGFETAVALHCEETITQHNNMRLTAINKASQLNYFAL